MFTIRKSYAVSQKLNVIAYAEHNSITATAMNFGISKSMVGRWNSMQCALAQAPLKARKLGSVPKPQFPKEEQYLFDAICEKSSHGYTVSCSQIQAKIRKRVGHQRFRASIGYMDSCIDTKLYPELALQQSIKSILACSTQ
jgi:hypothetical protein